MFSFFSAIVFALFVWSMIIVVGPSGTVLFLAGFAGFAGICGVLYKLMEKIK